MGAALAMRPLDLILSRCERVQQSGRGYRCLCPACGGKSRKLSVTEADNGAALLKCFSGCDAMTVMEAIGLRLSDLFPAPLRPLTDTERREARSRMKECGWRAALDMLDVEGAVVQIASKQLQGWQALSIEDDERLALACNRISNAALSLTGKELYRPDYCYPPARLVAIKSGSVKALRRELATAEDQLQSAEAALLADKAGALRGVKP